MQAMNSATAATVSAVRLAVGAAGGPVVDALDVERAGGAEQDGRADQQADVADADREEGLERGPAVGLVLPPVADQHERAEAHDLPAEDQLHHVRAPAPWRASRRRTR